MKITQLYLKLSVFLLGFATVTCQIVFIRELFIIYHGNEISIGLVLAIWLIWTSLGSSVSGSLYRKRPLKMKSFSNIQILFGLSIPATLLIIRYGQEFFISVPGELPGIIPLLTTAVLSLFLFCILSGALFSLAVHVKRISDSTAIADMISSVYLYELIGAGIGGLLTSLVIIPYFSSVQIVSGMAILNILAGFVPLLQTDDTLKASFSLLIRVFLVVVIFKLIYLVYFNQNQQWEGYQLLDQRNTRFGRLTVSETGTIKTIHQNGIPIIHFPDVQRAEESVHLALLFHQQPQKLLLIGGGLNGSIMEGLKHKSLTSIDYVEQDPVLLEIGKTYFKDAFPDGGSEGRLRLFEDDGRYFIKRSGVHYDVIILNISDPVTAQANRYYTIDFFREAKKRLNSNGILSFTITGSENFISEQLQNVVHCLQATLQKVFRHVYILPGDPIHFFATDKPVPDFSAEYLITQLQERHIETNFIREYYLPFRFMPDRLDQLTNEIQQSNTLIINSDVRPVAYYFSFMFWGSQFSGIYRAEILINGLLPLFIIIIGALFIYKMYQWRNNNRSKLNEVPADLSVLIMGFSVMSFQIFIMMIFQAYYGYLYYHISILIATFMLGMAVGTYTGREKQWSDSRALSVIHLAMAILPVILILTFLLKQSVFFYKVGDILILPLISLLCGFIGGVQFPVAGRCYHTNKTEQGTNTGFLYTMDLLGGFAGAILLSGLLIPLYGFYITALLIILLNLMIVALLYLAVRKSLANH